MVIGPYRLGREDATDSSGCANARDRLHAERQASASQGADHINQKISRRPPNPLGILAKRIKSIHVEADMKFILMKECSRKQPPPLMVNKADRTSYGPVLDLSIEVLGRVSDNKNGH